MKPCLARTLYVREHDHRVLFLNSEAPDWITINEHYRPIFDLFDGTHTVDHINDFIRDQFAAEENVLIPQIADFIKTSKVLEHNAAKLSQTVSRTNGTAQNPKYVYITLTDRCNLRCRYCYAVERKQSEDVGFDTWSRYIRDILSVAGTPVFIFTGGEPLLHQQLYELADLTKQAGCENILLSNGTMVTSEADAIRITNLFNLVKLSLDTLDESVATELRGRGIVTQVQGAFDLLRAAGCNVQILATVTASTRNDLDAFSKHFDNQVNFQPFYKMGRGRESDDLAVTGQEYYDALTKTDIFRLLPGFHRNIHGYRNRPFKRCAIAYEEISIDSAGNVFPCHMLHYPELVCGNLNTSGFADVYANSSVLSKLRDLNVDQMEQCKCCPFRNICGGACRARVDFSNQGIDGFNEFCTFEKNAILDALMYSYG